MLGSRFSPIPTAKEPVFSAPLPTIMGRSLPAEKTKHQVTILQYPGGWGQEFTSSPPELPHKQLTRCRYSFTCSVYCQWLLLPQDVCMLCNKAPADCFPSRAFTLGVSFPNCWGRPLCWGNSVVSYFKDFLLCTFTLPAAMVSVWENDLLLTKAQGAWNMLLFWALNIFLKQKADGRNLQRQ